MICIVDIRYVSTIFYILSLTVSIQPTEICDVERLFPCINFVVWTWHFLLPNQWLTWIVSLFHIRCTYCVIIMLITVKTLFYLGNAYENGFLNVFSTGNLFNSHAVTISHLRKGVEACSLHVNTDVFNTVHRKRHRFLTFFECILSKTYLMNKNGHTGSDIDAC